MNSVGRGDNKKEKNKASVMTRETVGMTLLLFGTVLFFITVTGRLVFGDPGFAITSFFLGLFGLYFYPLDLFLVYLGFSMVAGRKWISAKWIFRMGFLVLAVFAIVHQATAERFFGTGYADYLSGCWKAAGEGARNATGGGFVFGLVAYYVRFLLSAPGAYIFHALIALLSLFFIFLGTPLRNRVPALARTKREAFRMEEDASPVTFEDLSTPERTPVPADEPYLQYHSEQPAPTMTEAQRARRAAQEESRDILFGGDRASSYRNNLIFSRDSAFNAPGTRCSTERPRPRQEERAERTSDSSEGYSERYASEAETSRSAMPRKITPAERAYPAREESYNYPVTPTYRAPAPERTEPPRPEPVVEAEPERSEPRPAEPAPQEVRTERRADSARDAFRAIFSRPAPEPEPKETPRFGFSVRPEEQDEDANRVRDAFDELDNARRGVRFEEPKEEPTLRRSFEEPKEELTLRRSFEESKEEPTLRRSFEEPKEEPTLRRSFEEPKEEPTLRRSFEEPKEESAPRRGFEERSAASLFDDDDVEDFEEEYEEEELPTDVPRAFEGLRAPSRRESYRAYEEPVHAISSAPAPVPAKHVYKKYQCPSHDLLVQYNDTVTVSSEEIERNSAVIVETLAGFHIEAEVVKVTCGSAVTRYDIDVPGNVSVRNVTKRDAEIAMRLHARDGVNIYSNSEVGAISIEVPNSVRATVGLRSVMGADEYVNSKPNSLMFAIGKDVEGRNVCGNIVKMKHILVAGSTGSGKSVCLNAMLISLICKYSPEDLRLILIDPKKVEFAIFDGLPHLMINEIIADAQKAVTALNWSIKEMERRYSLFEQKTRSGMNVHNLDEYNACLTEDEEKLPKIVIVVDELADLMSVAKKDIEDRIQRLAQKARAAGMHLVIATQRPSVDVITGVIKGNLPTRLAFRVIQEVDSRTILDESGAEKLLGNGDMLYRTEGMFGCLRVQGAFIGSKEVQAIIENIKANNEAYFDSSVADYINKNESGEGGGEDDGDDGEVSPLYIKALGIVVKLGSASISLIQRKCSVGYNHAGKIIEWMEMMHYISAFEGKSKPRDVLLTKEEFEAKFGKLD